MRSEIERTADSIGGSSDGVEKREKWEIDMEALLKSVERESGAEGKSEPAARRRICCRFILEAFREGRFGNITLDNVFAAESKTLSASDDLRTEQGFSSPSNRVSSSQATRNTGSGGRTGLGASMVEREKDGEWQRLLPVDLDRDWSSASAWEIPEKSG